MTPPAMIPPDATDYNATSLDYLILTWSSPRRHIFLLGISFEWTTKLCIDFLNQFSFYFPISIVQDTI